MKHTPVSFLTSDFILFIGSFAFLNQSCTACMCACCFFAHISIPIEFLQKPKSNAYLTQYGYVSVTRFCFLMHCLLFIFPGPKVDCNGGTSREWSPWDTPLPKSSHCYQGNTVGCCAKQQCALCGDTSRPSS